MARKKKGELPSGSVRRQIYNGMKQKKDKAGNPMYDEHGKPIMIRDYISVTAASVKDAERERANVVLEKKGKVRPADITLYEAIDNYISSSSAILSPSTIHGYRTIQKHGFRNIIDMKLSSITDEEMRQAVNMEASRFTRYGKLISPKTVSNEYGLIHAVLEANNIHVSSSIKLPQKVKRFHELSDPEVIFSLVKGTEIELPVLLAMWLSFTVSEIRGLTKSKSLSADGNYISIKEVLVHVGRNDIAKSQAKRESRNRKHRIPDYIKDLIEKVETDRLVTMSAQTLYDKFTKLLAANNLPHMTFHDLRHVNASVMAILHVPDKYAQERGGWSSDRVMKDTYTQTFSKERIAVDDMIDDYFNSKLLGEAIDKRRYKFFLGAFDLEDNSESENLFSKVEDMIMQHEKNKP